MTSRTKRTRPTGMEVLTVQDAAVTFSPICRLFRGPFDDIGWSASVIL
ncbi:MAG TPA: hypothetical protein GX728_00740 [Clostridiaceae bacterium]|nr:hypothetical protein [Clostridiaceae bacterium]